MKIGYIRISTLDQNTARQEVLMEALEVDEIYIDRMSGKSADRPELRRMLEYVRRGDTVVVESISRFARNTRDLLELVERAHRERGGICLPEGGHRHHHAHRQVYAHRIRRGGGAGA